MAEFVDGVVDEGGRGVVEADTGTGKTLAYLVPVLRARHRTIVSTSTKALQDQLWTHDLPLAARVAGVAPATALLKGRANYLCLLSLDEQAQSPDLLLGERLANVRAWASTTATGDMAELGADATADVLSNLTRGVDTCEGNLCPFHGDCWAEKARARAGQADVVVTNHHLVFADAKLRGAGGEAAGMPLPPDGVLILDEAHTLDDAATSAFSAHLDDGRAARIMNAPRVRDSLGPDHTRAMSAVVAASARAFAALNRTVGLNRTTITDEIGPGLTSPSRRTPCSKPAKRSRTRTPAPGSPAASTNSPPTPIASSAWTIPPGSTSLSAAATARSPPMPPPSKSTASSTAPPVTAPPSSPPPPPSPSTAPSPTSSPAWALAARPNSSPTPPSTTAARPSSTPPPTSSRPPPPVTTTSPTSRASPTDSSTW